MKDWKDAYDEEPDDDREVLAYSAITDSLFRAKFMKHSGVNGQWFVCDPFGERSTDVSEYDPFTITHWTELNLPEEE